MSGGRPRTEDGLYARELGLMHRHGARAVRLMGGAKHLRSLDPDARAVLVAPFRYGKSSTVSDGGLKARGLLPRRRGVDTQAQYLIPPQVDFDGPLEGLVSDEDVDAAEVEGLGDLDEA